MPSIIVMLTYRTLAAATSLAGQARARAARRVPDRADRGQTTAEYALVLLGAAAVALLLLAWATSTNRVNALFNFVLDQIAGRVT
ncbi:MAG: DUF4244 domain-containing protein [Acidimicrobiia bacterium]|nr:DUF4244 domain-containing protein [Acidimicrobiia bacterium]